ncbi:MAG: cysteine desulfurase [Clostridiales bacterium]|jgi:cysteine desulfurase|nr:cysteine desulfurase [Clostridiales bacterium]
MQVYFDNAATTKPTKQVIDKMIQVYSDDYGNTSSLHTKGIEAENHIKESRFGIAKLLKVEEKELYFTSGGTESNNTAIFGAAYANQRMGKHIITTSIEHASVTNVLLQLEKEGFEITFLTVDEKGLISLNELEKSIRSDTILVSTIYVNNEIGIVQDVERIGKLIKRVNPKTLYHVDAVQAYGKLNIYPNKQNIDLLSASSHKIHGPKGVGLLFVKEKTKLRPLIFGGDHQRGMRSGTENTPGVVGFYVATNNMYSNIALITDKLKEIKLYFLDRIKEIEDIQINSDVSLTAPHIVSISFKDIKSEVLLHALETKGIYISTGSACSSNKPGKSSTISAIGVDKIFADGTIRFSFCMDNTLEEVDYCIDTLKQELSILRKYTRKK